jgi:hypothetical protein
MGRLLEGTIIWFGLSRTTDLKAAAVAEQDWYSATGGTAFRSRFFLRLISVGIIGIGMFLAGCSQSLDKKFSKLQRGMSKDQVVHIMGEPEAIDWASKSLNDGMVKWFYFTDEAKLAKPGRTKDGYFFLEVNGYFYSVNFINGKLVESGIDDYAENIFVKAKDLKRIRSKVDTFYERDLEKRIDK